MEPSKAPIVRNHQYKPLSSFGDSPMMMESGYHSPDPSPRNSVDHTYDSEDQFSGVMNPLAHSHHLTPGGHGNPHFHASKYQGWEVSHHSSRVPPSSHSYSSPSPSPQNSYASSSLDQFSESHYHTLPHIPVGSLWRDVPSPEKASHNNKNNNGNSNNGNNQDLEVL